jgi:hypothetical protein
MPRVVCIYDIPCQGVSRSLGRSHTGFCRGIFFGKTMSYGMKKTSGHGAVSQNDGWRNERRA